MKKILFAIAVVATLFATSCNKETNAPEELTCGADEFLATIDNGANPQNSPRVSDDMSTMTTINDNGYIIWQNGDQISINGKVYSTSKAGDGQAAVFNKTGEAATGTDYVAYYPASIVVEDVPTLPATQVFDATNLSNLPMYATSNTNKLTFNNICAVMKIIVPTEVSGATKIVVSCDNKAMNGAFTVNSNNAAVMSKTSNLTTEDKTLTVVKDANASTVFTPGETVYVAIPAESYTNFKLKFLNGSATLWSKTIASCTLQVNTIYPANFTPNYFCLTVTKAGSLVLPNGRNCLQYRKSTDTDWSTFNPSSSSGSTSIYNSLSEGDKIYFRSTSSTQKDYVPGVGSGSLINSSSKANFAVSGNIMYLLKQEDPGTTLPTYKSWGYGAFEKLFYECTQIVDASGLILPAATLQQDCYKNMFNGCTSLTKGPELPAASLVTGCYYQMFYGCRAIEEVIIYANTNLTADATTNSKTGALYKFLGTSNSAIWAGSASAASKNKFHCTQAFKTQYENAGVIKTTPYSDSKKYWEWCVDL